jgi:hypothetical protein
MTLDEAVVLQLWHQNHKYLSFEKADKLDGIIIKRICASNDTLKK